MSQSEQVSERLLATSSSLQTKTSTSRFVLTATAVALPTANQGGKVPHGRIFSSLKFLLASNRDKNCSQNGRYPVELILDNASQWSKCATRHVRGSRGGWTHPSIHGPRASEPSLGSPMPPWVILIDLGFMT